MGIFLNSELWKRFFGYIYWLIKLQEYILLFKLTHNYITVMESLKAGLRLQQSWLKAIYWYERHHKVLKKKYPTYMASVPYELRWSSFNTDVLLGITNEQESCTIWIHCKIFSFTIQDYWTTPYAPFIYKFWLVCKIRLQMSSRMELINNPGPNCLYSWIISKLKQSLITLCYAFNIFIFLSVDRCFRIMLERDK